MNFVVFKVMITAITVGMVGVYVLQRRGVLETQISETAYVSNIVGYSDLALGYSRTALALMPLP